LLNLSKSAMIIAHEVKAAKQTINVAEKNQLISILSRRLRYIVVSI